MNILVLMNENYFGLYSPIRRALTAMGHSTDIVEVGKETSFTYHNLVHRTYGLLSRSIFQRNIKSAHKSRKVSEILERTFANKSYDIVIVNHPDILQAEQLDTIRKNSKHLIAHLWDSSGKEPRFFKHLNKFDKVLSFDPTDVKKYGFIPITNYLDSSMNPLNATNSCEQDVFCIISYDKARYRLMQNILNRNPSISFNFNAYFSSSRRMKYAQDKRINNITTPMAPDHIKTILGKHKAILDIGHNEQHGLSFRVIDSIGLQRKLITTNPHVRTSDIFHPNNTAVIDPGKPVIDKNFLDSAYVPQSEETITKYHIDTWVTSFLDKAVGGQHQPHSIG